MGPYTPHPLSVPHLAFKNFMLFRNNTYKYYPYNKVTGSVCVCVCVCATKDLAIL